MITENKMKKTTFFAAVVAFAITPFVFGDEGEVKLIYPTDAASTELDSSKPERRVEPPVREESEVDPVTPIGQIREVLKSLKAIEENQAEVQRDVAALKKLDISNLIPVVEKSVEGQKEITDTVNAANLLIKNIGAKVDVLQKTTENIGSKVEVIQKTAAVASTVATRSMRWTDYAICAICFLFLIQLVWKAWSAVSVKVKARAQAAQDKAVEKAILYLQSKQKTAEQNNTKESAS